MIKLSHDDWAKIKHKLVTEYGKSILISYVCKQKLGFIVRDHKAWTDNWKYKQELQQYEDVQQAMQNRITGGNSNQNDFALDMLLAAPPVKGHYTYYIALDFYDDAKETWFRLKYL